MTIHRASFSPNSFSASSETCQARQVKATTEISQTAQGRDEKTRNRGMPTSVPAVPGARGAYPLPKPVAASVMNFLYRRHLFSSDPGGNSAYRR